MTVKLIRHTWIGGKPLDAGEQVQVSERKGNDLIITGRAVAVEIEEPTEEIENGDSAWQ